MFTSLVTASAPAGVLGTALAPLADAPAPVLDHTRLIVFAIIGVALIIVLITALKVHPFLSLFAGALTIGLGAGFGPESTLGSFTSGLGSTMAGVGLLIVLGAMFGKLLADSGGADRIVDTLVARSSAKWLPWTMALVGALIGLPMFFEVGLVLLIPVILLVARRTGMRLMRIAIPTLAGLSVMHGLVPPHPGPLAAIASLNANLGITLILGIIVAIPTVIIAGPVFSKFAAKWVDVPVPDLVGSDDSADDPDRRRPSFIASVSCVLLPVILMLARAIADIVTPDSTGIVKQVLDFLGTPAIALSIALVVGMFVLGRGGGLSWAKVNGSIGASLPPIAGILLIVGAGGGLKQVLVDTGLGDVIASFVAGSAVPVLLLAWVIAVLIRVATGSATVATVTAAGILAPVAATLPQPMVALMVLAIGAGSLFLSHVNDAGFWLVKEYMGVSIGQNLKTWTLMECIISVAALAFIMIINLGLVLLGII